MKKTWANVQLGEVLIRRKRQVVVDDVEHYKRVTIRLNNGGVALRDCELGERIGTKTQFRVKEGDFIISKIDARNGAFGVVPLACDDAIITGNFWTFEVNKALSSSRYLYWLSRSPLFLEFSITASEGTTNRRYLQEQAFYRLQISLPSLAEQQRIVDHLDAIESRLTHAQKLRKAQEVEILAALRSAFHKLEAKADWIEMSEVAPLVRREVDIDPEESYPELGIRSFGRGTFHKAAVLGMDTTKRLFEIHAGDLMFSNVFAWEGAIAVAQPEDHGRLGSHRFISCVCDRDRVLPDYLQFYFLTPDGLEKIGKASPGGAGRNRTLGIEKLADIKVPILPLATQLEFKKLLDLQNRVRAEAALSSQRTSSLLPSLLDRIFDS